MGSPADAPQAADHHYIPKFYLKGFTDKQGILWAYERNKAPRASSPRAEANREDYYTFSDRGYADDSVEKILSKAESLAAPIFRKIANPQFQLSDQQRLELYSFVAMMFVRVPAYREFVDKAAGQMMRDFTKQRASNAEEFYASLREFEAKTGNNVGDYEKLREFALSGNYTVTQGSVGFNLRMSFQTALYVSEISEREYNHDIWYAPADSFFMTCDNPIAAIRPDTDGSAWVGGGFGWRDTEVIFPLNKRACLILRRRGKRISVAVDERRTQHVNALMMGVAQRYLYAPRGYRRISRIFDERGCKIKYGENALMCMPPYTYREG